MFRSRKSDDKEIQDRLRQLETLAFSTRDSGGDAVYFNQAGDLCASVYQPIAALEYYGHSIDSYVKADRFDAATAVCKKVIRLSPRVVRAHCTLAWLAIGNGFVSEAQDFVDHYLTAAAHAERDLIARHQVKRMSAIAEAEPLRLYLAERLLDMGDDTASDSVFGAIFRERNGLPVQPRDPRRRWIEARRCALMGPDQIAA